MKSGLQIKWMPITGMGLREIVHASTMERAGQAMDNGFAVFCSFIE